MGGQVGEFCAERTRQLGFVWEAIFANIVNTVLSILSSFVLLMIVKAIRFVLFVVAPHTLQ